jgi:hypothetical protein
MIRRLRSLPPLFFIGLFPVVCLLWLWADSVGHQTSWAYCRDPQHRRVVSLGDSSIYLEHMTIQKREPGNDAGFKLNWTGERGDWSRDPADASKDLKLFPKPEANLFTPLTLGGGGGPDLHIYSLELPFWLLLSGWLPPWLLLAWWQARRRRRKKKREAALPVD